MRRARGSLIQGFGRLLLRLELGLELGLELTDHLLQRVIDRAGCGAEARYPDS